MAKDLFNHELKVYNSLYINKAWDYDINETIPVTIKVKQTKYNATKANWDLLSMTLMFWGFCLY